MSRIKASKGRHLVKCAATGIFFAGLSSDLEVLAVTNTDTQAESLADEQAAIYTAELLKARHGSFAWVPAFQ